ncbi:MAG: hypothetical protein LQ340_004079 [Diploschistes diacapsis]|nr:MAG: hypothetical protein LQ340_004079 [Diploschistes diacapsis]
MPPALSASETESDAGDEVIMGRPEEQDAAVNEENGEEGDQEDDDEVTYARETVLEVLSLRMDSYVVEKILEHVVDKGTVLYQVKWQGYPSDENTWEPEENLVGAKDILDAYFEKIGGRPTASKANSAKKRGRKSNASVAETPEPTSKKAKTGFEGRRGRPPKRNSGEDLVWPTVNAESWTPPKPTKDAWEDLISSIETIEVEENGTRWAFLLWAIEDENGRKRTTKANLQSVYIAAPQAMLRFYENHLLV